MSSSAARLSLTTPQLAFVRAWAEGIDPVVAWERFLSHNGAADVRTARQELARLLEELRRVARLHGRPDIAALLSRDPEAIVGRESMRPTLEQFRQGFDDDFYSEAELLQLYQDAYGKLDARSSARRRQRLRDRLLQALQWLQQKSARPPLPGDPIRLWFDERVALRLATRGVRTLADLMFLVRDKGFFWHRQVPRLGPVGAGHIARWLREHETTLGALPDSALRPRNALDLAALAPPAQTALVPIERLVLPNDDRSGRTGLNRAPETRCKLQARTDLDAVNAWLATVQTRSHTWRAYRREAERLLLWSVLERRKALSSLDGQDCIAYRDFLGAPGAHWLGPRHSQRCSPAWRPLEGPLSASSQVTAEAIVRTLCDWLVRQRYLASNPWDDVPRRAPVAAGVKAHRLAAADRGLIQFWLEAMPKSPAQARLNALIHLAVFNGLQLAMLARAKVSWLRRTDAGGAAQRWSLQVAGRTPSQRELPLPDAAMAALMHYFGSRGLSPTPAQNLDETPLLAHLGSNAHVSPARLRDILAKALNQCALSVYPSDRLAAGRLREASILSLRPWAEAGATVGGGTVPPRAGP